MKFSRNYTSEGNPMERCEFNWFQWQWLKFLAWLGIIPTYKEEENHPISVRGNIRFSMGKYYTKEQWETRRKEVLKKKLP